MTLLDPENGLLCFEDGFMLSADNAPSKTEGIVNLGIHRAFQKDWKVLYMCGGVSAKRVWIIPLAQNNCKETAGEIRSKLLMALGLNEPENCTMRSFGVRFPFGMLYICTEPYTGRSEALLCYSSTSEVIS